MLNSFLQQSLEKAVAKTNGTNLVFPVPLAKIRRDGGAKPHQLSMLLGFSVVLFT